MCTGWLFEASLQIPPVQQLQCTSWLLELRLGEWCAPAMHQPDCALGVWTLTDVPTVSRCCSSAMIVVGVSRLVELLLCWLGEWMFLRSDCDWLCCRMIVAHSGATGRLSVAAAAIACSLNKANPDARGITQLRRQNNEILCMADKLSEQPHACWSSQCPHVPSGSRQYHDVIHSLILCR